MTTAAAKEIFMEPAPQNAAALPWLADAAAFNTEKSADWVRALRATGAESFARTGLPTPAWEGWQYLNLRPLSSMAFHYAAGPVVFDAAKIPAPLLGQHRVVLVNGQYQPKLSSMPAHVTVMSLMEAAEKNIPGLQDHLVRLGDLAATPMMALNSAYLRDGLVLTVEKNKDVEAPVEVLFYNSGDGVAIYPRVAYLLGENSGLTIVERHMGEGAYFANAFIAVGQESASRLRYYRFQDESGKSSHFSYLGAQLKKDTSFEAFSLSIGAGICRQECRLQLLDQGISSNIGGIYLMKGQQGHDFSVVADHFEPGGASAQHFRGVVDDKARAVYQGKIHVRRSAQKTDGYQSHHALLLSEQAEASVKPELEIYADDVKCSHGATSGHLDPVALFYLRSRGIPAKEAKALLVQSFLAEALKQITYQPIESLCAERVAAWLAGRAA